MDCDRTKTLLHHLLPDEIVEEILFRADVESLLRCRCVLKSWRSLIDSDWFINNHYRISTENPSLARHRVIFDSNFSEMKQCSLQLMLDKPHIHPFSFDEEADDKPMSGGASVVGCCDGLFCVVTSSGRYFLWNLATKVFFKLPEIPLTQLPYVWPKRGFGRDEATGAYKVFALSSEPVLDDDNNNIRDPNYERVARVYSSETNSWAAVDHGSLSVHNDVGSYACGNLHWVTKSGDGIESFDLKSEAFGNIEMPPLEGGEVWLGEVRGCLSAMHELEGGGADVWVMKEHGSNESWQKLICIPRYDYRRGGCLVGPSPSLPGEMLLISGRNFSVCGAVKHKKIEGRFQRWRRSFKASFTGCYRGLIESLDLNTYDYDTYFYVESLVSPLPR